MSDFQYHFLNSYVSVYSKKKKNIRNSEFNENYKVFNKKKKAVPWEFAIISCRNVPLKQSISFVVKICPEAAIWGEWLSQQLFKCAFYLKKTGSENWGSTSGDQKMLMLSLIYKKSFDGEKITLNVKSYIKWREKLFKS